MYRYSELRPQLFTDEGQRTFLLIRDHVHKTLRLSGAITIHAAISVASGDSWLMLACVDRMVELGEIKEVTNTERRIFVSTKE